MIYDDLFIQKNLPDPLTKEELSSCFEKYKQGDLNAREKIIIHNIRLVKHQVLQRYLNSPYEKNELVAVGILGLIKSVNTYDVDKGIEFTTYAGRCINNEILLFIRKQKKHLHDKSIYEPIKVDGKGNEICIDDILTYEDNIYESCFENQDIYEEIKNEVSKLKGRNKEIIILFFGFEGNRRHTQAEIGAMFNLSRSYISKIIKDNLVKIGRQLKDKGIIDKKGIITDIECSNFDKSDSEPITVIPNANLIISYLNSLDNDTKYEYNGDSDLINDEIKEYINSLPTRDKKIILLSLGFDGNRRHTQVEISQMLCLSRSRVSKIVVSIIKGIGEELKAKNLIYEIKKTSNKDNIISTEEIENKDLNDSSEESITTSQIKIFDFKRSIYEQKILYEALINYINKLDDQDKNIISLYFGLDGSYLHPQQAIAREYNMTKTCIANIIKRHVEQIVNELKEQGIISNIGLICDVYALISRESLQRISEKEDLLVDSNPSHSLKLKI